MLAVGNIQNSKAHAAFRRTGTANKNTSGQIGGIGGVTEERREKAKSEEQLQMDKGANRPCQGVSLALPIRLGAGWKANGDLRGADSVRLYGVVEQRVNVISSPWIPRCSSTGWSCIHACHVKSSMTPGGAQQRLVGASAIACRTK